MGWNFGYRPYVSVGERREIAKRKMDKLRKQGIAIQAVEIGGRKIAGTFWGQSWCQHLESFSDYANRLPRGRTYVRNGSVCHLEVAAGGIKAIVSGSELYDVKIRIKELPKKKWGAVKERCSGKIGSLLELLQGRLSNSVMTVVTDRNEGLFPLPSEISLDCSCPDWAVMCKHVAAVLYGVGARLDEKPELLFLLRGVDHEELIEADAVAAATTIGSKRGGRRIAESDLEDLFGIEMLAEKSPSQPKTRSTEKSPTKTIDTKPTKPVLSTTSDSSPTGRTVEKLRDRLGMSQTQLAQLLDVSAASVRTWEKTTAPLNLQPRSTKALNIAGKLTKKQAWAQLRKCRPVEAQENDY